MSMNSPSNSNGNTGTTGTTPSASGTGPANLAGGTLAGYDSDVAGESIGDTTGSRTASLKSNLGQAGSHLKQAAGHAGVAVKGAASAAGEEMRLGKANVKSELAESALSGIAAAEVATAAGREQVDALMDKGRDLIESASELIRERPLASFGIAFATGWVIAKLARSGDK
jgi:ElaB/YqjD/DUF883 family membrane-anchored ribosome-binding protein